MPEKEKIMRPVKRIKGGCFLPHLKDTAELETVEMRGNFFHSFFPAYWSACKACGKKR